MTASITLREHSFSRQRCNARSPHRVLVEAIYEDQPPDPGCEDANVLRGRE